MPEHIEQIDPTGILEGYAPHRPYDAHEDEQQLVARLEERFREAERERQAWESDANFYLMYLQGDQMVVRNRSTNELFRVQLANENSRVKHSIDNICRPAARALTGKLSRIVPTCTVIPRTEDYAELQGALVADSLLDYVSRKEDLRAKYARAQGQLNWAGVAIWQVLWDKNAGRDISWCATCLYVGEEEEAGQPCPQCSLQAEQQAMEQSQEQMAQWEVAASQAQMMGEPPPEQRQPQQAQNAPTLTLVNEGDIRVELHDPRDVFVDPGATCFQDARWVCVRRALPVSEVREMFADRAEFIHAEDGLYTDRAMGFYGSVYGSRKSTEELKEHCYLYKFYENATEMHPKGREIFMANHMILEERPSQYHKLGRLGFYKMVFEPIEGDFYAEPPMAQAWHIQRERNKLLTQLRTHRDLTNNPQKLVPMNSRITQSEWDDSPGRVLSYNPMGGKPDYLELPSFADYVYTELDRMRLAILEKFSVTDQEMGRSQADSSGRYAAILEAQASEAIAPIVVRNNSEWIELHRAILVLAQCYFLPTRTWTVSGRERIMTYRFQELNLTPGWDISLAEDDSLSRNPALRLEQARGLLKDGVFTDPQTGLPDMRLFRRVAGLKVPGVGPDLTGSEHSYASQVPEIIKRQGFFQPQWWDDARIMAEELCGWLRGPGRWEDPALVQQVGQVWMAYVAMMAPAPGDQNIMPSQGQMQMQMGGGQGQAGVPTGGQAGPQASNVANDAAQISKNADDAGERQANPNGTHEG
jgi:hypothetical protein